MCIKGFYSCPAAVTKLDPQFAQAVAGNGTTFLLKVATSCLLLSPPKLPFVLCPSKRQKNPQLSQALEEMITSGEIRRIFRGFILSFCVMSSQQSWLTPAILMFRSNPSPHSALPGVPTHPGPLQDHNQSIPPAHPSLLPKSPDHYE